MSQRDKGLFGGTCKTTGCDTTGVMGIPGQPNFYASGDEMNVSHRCKDCNTLIDERLGDLLTAIAAEQGITDVAATTHPAFIAGGRRVLGMNRDELRGRGDR